MPFFHYYQNNTHGVTHADHARGIDRLVIIEAVDHVEANERARSIGLYFNGIDTGRDCACCGNRWHPMWPDAAEPYPIDDDELPAFIHWADRPMQRAGALRT
jgi:hypothetical protein